MTYLATGTSRPLSATTHEALPRLKSHLGRTLTRSWKGVVPASLVQRAIQEAATIAETTEFPALFLPELAEEQVRRVAVFASSPAPQLPRRQAAPLPDLCLACFA